MTIRCTSNPFYLFQMRFQFRKLVQILNKKVEGAPKITHLHIKNRMTQNFRGRKSDTYMCVDKKKQASAPFAFRVFSVSGLAGKASSL